MTPAGMDPYVESTYDPYSLPDPFNPREKINKEILDELLIKLEMKIKNISLGNSAGKNYWHL